MEQILRIKISLLATYPYHSTSNSTRNKLCFTKKSINSNKEDQTMLQKLFIKYLLGTILLIAPTPGLCDWQADLEARFDIVDTVDQYQDWTPEVTSTLPQKTTGGNSDYMHNVYYYDSTIPVANRTPVITTYPGKSVNDGKAYRVNWLGNGDGNSEASNLQFFFGNGSETSGYSDLNLFFATYIPSDRYVTEYRDVDTVNSRFLYRKTEGKSPLRQISAKMVEISAGYINVNEWSDDKITSNQCRWGWSEVHFFLGQVRGDSENNEIRTIMSSGGGYFSVQVGAVDVSPWLDQVFWVEIHLTKESAIGVADGFASVTFYDAQGNSTEVLRVEKISLLNPNSACQTTSGVSVARGNTMKWNWINFESNWRSDTNKYYCCENLYDSSNNYIRPLDCSQYYDDIIIDDQRIGPTYFQLLAGLPVTEENVPIIDIMDSNTGDER